MAVQRLEGRAEKHPYKALPLQLSEPDTSSSHLDSSMTCTVTPGMLPFQQRKQLSYLIHAPHFGGAEFWVKGACGIQENTVI